MIQETYKDCEIRLTNEIRIEIWDKNKKVYVEKGYTQGNIEDIHEFVKLIIDNYREHPEQFEESNLSNDWLEML